MPKNYKSFLLVVIQFSCIAFIVIYAGVLGSLLQNLVTISALLLGLWAIATMKFSVNVFPDVREKHHFYHNGPYQFIRHPMYTAVLLTTLVWVFNRLDAITCAVWVVLLINLLLKISYEETMLTKKFQTYSEYQKTTSKLIPFVY